MAAEKPRQHDQADAPKQGRPAQVPGDAESPPQGTPSPAGRKAAEHTDPTEPTRSQQDRGR